MISAEAATWIRYAYMVLSMLVAALLAGSVVVRWDRLDWGERIMRFCLIGEHITFVYGGYLALTHHLAAPATVILFLLWLIGIVLGFLVWCVNVTAARRS